MSKTKTIYVCQSCGTQYPKWQGRCSACNEWNSLTEEIELKNTHKIARNATPILNQPQRIADIGEVGEERKATPDKEMNRVLGGGLVDGAVMLLGGEPGIGKSTLLLQLALQTQDMKILYVSGEESSQQIKMRATRIPFSNEHLFIVSETHLEAILKFYEQVQPDLVVIDSIQTIYSDVLESAPGSVSQVRECASQLIRSAKARSIPLFLVGHITKEGTLAGPKVLEHMVDTVLTFEGDRHNSYRIVRTQKNRFGSTLEMGIYEMHNQGLREVSNPSEIFLSQGNEELSGVAIAATLEGLRPLLIETQALVATSAYGTPQRSATGFDLRRLNMLLAVLEKRCGFTLGQKDVFINMVGGIKVEDPAIDLSLIVSVISSLHDIAADRRSVFAAEVGLSGEIRPVSRIEPRIAEAAKLGFKRMFISAQQQEGLTGKYPNIQLIGVHKLEEVFNRVFS